MRVVLLIVCLTVFLIAKENYDYGDFIDKQIALTLQLNSDTIDDESVDTVLLQKQKLYEKKLEEILANKNRYLHADDPYGGRIYKLQKIIAINKRRGNDYAVVRDEVLVKSYRILQRQNEMFREILRGLDLSTFDKFSNFLNEAFLKNQKEISKINDRDYKPYLQVEGNSKVVSMMKQRIREYYAILDINAEIITFIANSQRKMYRLNKYYRFGLIKPVLYINNLPVSHVVEPYLEKINLSTVKVMLILLVALFFYFARYGVLKAFVAVVSNMHFRNAIVNKMLQEMKKPVEILATIIALNLIVYIYNDFSRTVFLSSLFDMFYVIIVMWSIYKALNLIATAKINELAKRSTHVKSELINITIKITNFVLILTTILILLHLMGVNLTAILSGLGIGGFAIALAAKDSLANFFGTISILMSDTFSQGDWIVVDKVEGVVVEIGLRVTTIRTFDNALISIPNSKLANEAIKNWNRRKVGRRIKFTASLKYDSPREKLEEAIEKIRNLLTEHPGIAKESSAVSFQNSFEGAKLVSRNDALGIKNMQLVTIDALAASSIDILVYCFSTTTDWIEWANVKDEVILGVMEIFEELGLEFAFPSLSIYPEEEMRISVDTAQAAAIPAKGVRS